MRGVRGACRAHRLGTRGVTPARETLGIRRGKSHRVSSYNMHFRIVRYSSFMFRRVVRGLSLYPGYDWLLEIQIGTSLERGEDVSPHQHHGDEQGDGDQ